MEVCLLVTVRFGDEVVDGLSEQNFEIYEDGRREENAFTRRDMFIDLRGLPQ